MIEIYTPYFILVLLCVAVFFFLLGYVLCSGFVRGERIDSNHYEILLKKLQIDLDLEIAHGKQLEEANEAILNERSFKETFTEMHKGHTKVLVDVESNKAKIPEIKKFKRRKLGVK